MRHSLLLGIGLMCLVSCRVPETVPFRPQAPASLSGREICLLDRGTEIMRVGGNLQVRWDTYIMDHPQGSPAWKPWDPALGIAEVIRSQLNARFHTSSANYVVHTLQKYTSDICANNFSADLILDVQTYNWSIESTLFHPDLRLMKFSAFISLIDNKSRKVVAECAVDYTTRTEPEVSGYLLKSFAMDSWSMTKEELRRAIEECVKQFWAKTMNTDPYGEPLNPGMPAAKPKVYRLSWPRDMKNTEQVPK